ncbi:uncharacterized protein LOC124446212 [Xenia sp. Carnegie-2017]|uniref:uncharacterized protein LOC124446212 n=1 Tax=Xenia sp. Carnegie-2017 TaxID=2897299 RepID=UPI001F04CB23|nr:uncharacterized protein LOC124446212 [Xenia sp. Carnegie-2017]
MMAADIIVIVAVCAVGIFGNTLVIITILKPKILLKKNYYFLVLVGLNRFFLISGVSMMLIISVLRYRAIVHPLKLSFSRRKIKIACGLVYIIGLVAKVGTIILKCVGDPERRYYIYDFSGDV